MGNVINASVPVVLTMTTVPWRINHTLKIVKEILSGLTGYTYLVINIPKIYRLGWEIDETVVSKFPKDPRLIVNRTEDYGPATKFIPTLDLYPPDKKAILIIMDDSEYHLNMIKKIVETQDNNRESVHTYYTYSYNGITIPQGVDLISFWWPMLDGLKNYWHEMSSNESCWRVDDLVLGGYLRDKGIPIKALSRDGLKWVWKPIPPNLEGKTLFGSQGGESRESSMAMCVKNM